MKTKTTNYALGNHKMKKKRATRSKIILLLAKRETCGKVLLNTWQQEKVESHPQIQIPSPVTIMCTSCRRIDVSGVAVVPPSLSVDCIVRFANDPPFSGSWHSTSSLLSYSHHPGTQIPSLYLLADKLPVAMTSVCLFMFYEHCWHNFC